MKDLYEAERHRRVADAHPGGLAWWYVDRTHCTFHHDNGTSILIPTSRIKRALETLDQQMAQAVEEQP